jgi:hypothetical protein
LQLGLTRISQLLVDVVFPVLHSFLVAQSKNQKALQLGQGSSQPPQAQQPLFHPLSALGRMGRKIPNDPYSMKAIG